MRKMETGYEKRKNKIATRMFSAANTCTFSEGNAWQC